MELDFSSAIEQQRRDSDTQILSREDRLANDAQRLIPLAQEIGKAKKRMIDPVQLLTRKEDEFDREELIRHIGIQLKGGTRQKGDSSLLIERRKKPVIFSEKGGQRVIDARVLIQRAAEIAYEMQIAVAPTTLITRNELPHPDDKETLSREIQRQQRVVAIQMKGGRSPQGFSGRSSAQKPQKRMLDY